MVLGLIHTLLRDGADPRGAVVPSEARAYAKEFARRGLSFELLQRAYRMGQRTLTGRWLEQLRSTAADTDHLAAPVWGLGRLGGGVITDLFILPDGRLRGCEGPNEARWELGEDGRLVFFGVDGSTFLDGDYLIKGVAGRILWSLLGQYDQEGRVEFSNREVRLDPTLELPEFRDNLESRLTLLKRRLNERAAPIHIEKTGRGRFRLVVDSPLRLEAVGGPAEAGRG